MHIKIICPETRNLKMAGFAKERFSPRISSFVKFEVVEFKGSKSGDAHYKKNYEEKEVSKQLGEKDYLILLDEKGKEYSSHQLAQYMNKVREGFPSKKIVFLVGGPYGVSENLQKRAQAKISLSKLTFNSEVAIAVLFEQVYRILTINGGHPYHND